MVPLKTDNLTIAVAEAELDRLTRRPGAMRWKLGLGELYVNVLAQLPEPVPIRVGDTEYPVRPLDQIVASDPSVARVLDRVHEARARIRK